MKKTTIWRLIASFIVSNIGLFLVEYAGWKMDFWGDHVAYKLMLVNGIYFLIGSLINLLIPVMEV